MEQSPSAPANRSTSQETFQILLNPEVYYRIHNSQPHVQDLCRAHQVHAAPPPSHFLMTHFNICLCLRISSDLFLLLDFIIQILFGVE
jgi:hypothetical protein